jgi:alginate O-acetyltransferase complex protein AlgJ
VTAQPSHSTRTIPDIALIGVFIAAIFLPPVLGLLGTGRDTNLTEERTPVARPALTLDVPGLRNFHRTFEGYWNDAFGLRGTFVRSYNRLALWMGVSLSTTIVSGKEGWLFVGEEYHGVESYRATRPFTTHQLKWWQRTLEARRDWLAQRGIRFLFIVAPEKQTIYPEYMPARLNRVGTATRLDQLVAHLARHSDSRVLDLRDALLGAKAHDRVYEPLDSHWNDLGAWIAYAEIAKQLSVWFPQVRPAALGSFEREQQAGFGNDLSRLLSLSDLMPGDRLALVPRVPRRARWQTPDGMPPKPPAPFLVSEIDDPGLPRAVMFHDSFAEALRPFLSENFARIAYAWQTRLDLELIEREKPDVVLYELVERSLMGDFAPDPEEVRQAWRPIRREPRS